MFAISIGQYICIAIVVNILAISRRQPAGPNALHGSGHVPARLGDHRADGLAHGHRVSWLAELDPGVVQRVEEVVVGAGSASAGAANAAAAVSSPAATASRRMVRG